jgi:hypothetical protein
MVIAWLRSLLIFDGFLAPEGTETVPMPETAGESWLRQLLVLDGFLEAERAVRSSESETTVASVWPESVVRETTVSVEAEIYPHSDEAVTDWQRILGWKE